MSRAQDARQWLETADNQNARNLYAILVDYATKNHGQGRGLIQAIWRSIGLAELCLNDFAAARCAQVEAERDNALANADFWERELNNFRRNAAHRADHLAKEKVETAESEVTKLRKEIEIRQKVIHFGQYHQWATYDICQEKGCANTRKLATPSREADND
jgi:hypothetical protein